MDLSMHELSTRHMPTSGDGSLLYLGVDYILCRYNSGNTKKVLRESYANLKKLLKSLIFNHCIVSIVVYKHVYYSKLYIF